MSISLNRENKFIIFYSNESSFNIIQEYLFTIKVYDSWSLKIDLTEENFFNNNYDSRLSLSNYLKYHKKTNFTLLLADISPHQKLCSTLLDILGTSHIHKILRLDPDTNNFHPHRPLEQLAAKTLAVFPGKIIPLTMGSHRRIYQVCKNLLKLGHPVDLLITGKEAMNAIPFLEQISPRIYCYGLNDIKLPAFNLIRRHLITWISAKRGNTAPPYLFSERLIRSGSFSGAKHLRRLAEKGKYTNIIISYAWLDRIRRLVHPSIRSQIRWFCDTHDVQFIRNDFSKAAEYNLFTSISREKKLELSVLKNYNKVISISSSDNRTLCAELSFDNVISASNGFDYALRECKAPDPLRPVFGFIGRNMEANVLALQEIFSNWWPAIQDKWPESQLRIAGEITENNFFKRKVFSSSVLNDGIVSDLNHWLTDVDVMINPVIIQGGINFKAIEALMAGRLLLTNSKGGISLGNDNLALICKNGQTAVRLLEQEFSHPQNYLKKRASIQKICLKNFGDNNALKMLFHELQTPQIETSTLDAKRPFRILIQVGDHLENRDRTLPLAKALSDLGHHPIIMVYDHDFVAPFLGQGLDCVALYDFNESQKQKRHRLKAASKIKILSKTYRGFDLDDVTDTDQLKDIKSFRGAKNLQSKIKKVTHDIDRCLRYLEHVQPDMIFVWNGHTGNVANILRHCARTKGLPSYYIERSIFCDGLFLDPNGSNGNSELANLDIDGLISKHSRAAPRRRDSLIKKINEKDLVDLRQSGAWAKAKKIIFVPLQVELDTNVLLHSPRIKNMFDLVTEVNDLFGGPDIAIVVRPHPEEINFKLRLPDLKNVYLTAHGDLEKWIQLSDLVVTINSTVGLTALLHGKKTLSLGDGIYTNKGLSDGCSATEDHLDIFWDVLISRYTSLPESPIPDCIKELIHKTPKVKLKPCNYYGLDHINVGEATSKKLREFMDEVLNIGVLKLHTNLTFNDSLNLNYREVTQPISSTTLKTHFYNRLNLPEKFKLIICEDKAAKAAILKIPKPSSQINFDRYGWVLPLTEEISSGKKL